LESQQTSSLNFPQLIDLCVKNGGDHFLVEIASKEFMDNLVSILKYPGLNHEVKQKILRLVQNWAASFEGKPLLSYTSQTYKTLKHEGALRYIIFRSYTHPVS
jgi:growth factor-regulated tyrosine kinase substrate